MAPQRPAARALEAGGEGGQTWRYPLAARRDHRLERFARERQDISARKSAEHRRGNHAAVHCRQRLHVEGDNAPGRYASGLRHHMGIADPVARRRLLDDGEGAVGGGDQHGLFRRHQAAQHRAPGLHQFGGEHDVDIARRGHQRQHRRAAVLGGQHLDVIDGRAGPLRDAGHQSRLRAPAAGFGERDDPVGQHAAALPAHRQHGERDRLLRVEPERLGNLRLGVHRVNILIRRKRCVGLRGGAANSRSPRCASRRAAGPNASDCG